MNDVKDGSVSVVTELIVLTDIVKIKHKGTNLF